MIQRFADWLVYDIFGLDASTALGEAINFFFYDTIKILILLFFISVIMGIINAYFPIERLRNYLTSRKLYGLQYFFAALFGAITPFCSCSSIPLFIGFVKGGIPLGVTFAYLITSPLVNEVAVAMFIGTFGLRITSIYVISGIMLGMVGGFILGKMKLEPYLSDWVKQIQQNSTSDSGTWEKEHTPFFRRLPIIMQEAWGIVKGVLLYILIGIGIGAFNYCTGLTSVTIPDSVTSIGDYAFSECSGLTSVTFQGAEPPTFDGSSNVCQCCRNSTGN